MALLDPVLIIPIYLQAADRLDSAARRRFAARVSAIVFLVLFGSAFAGPALFAYFDLSLASLQIAGGSVLFSMGLAMLLGHELAVKGAGSASSDEALAVPIAIPLLAGPASISYVMTQQATSGPWISLACLAGSLGVLIALFYAQRIAARLRPGHLALIERVAGLFVTVMAIETLGKGLKAMFPALG